MRKTNLIAFRSSNGTREYLKAIAGARGCSLSEAARFAVKFAALAYGAPDLDQAPIARKRPQGTADEGA